AEDSKKKVSKSVTDYESMDFKNNSKNSQDKEWNLKISCWNVDGIRAWMGKGGLDFLEYEKPNILCLQETKCSQDKLPDEVKNVPGYHAYWLASDKDGYAGVSIYTTKLAMNVQYGLQNEELDTEGRIITAEYEQFYLICTYVPNAGRKLVTLDKRLKWNEEFRKYVKELDKKKPVIICGDMNVAHKEIGRYCMIAAPLVTWAYVEQWTHTALDKVDSCPLQLDVTHPLHVEWEALAQVLDVVLSRLLQAEPRPNVAEGLRLLQRCVASEPRAPLILSLLLSFISALFVFLSCAYSQLAGPGVGSAGAELLPRVLDKIFAALVYEGTPPEDRSSRNVKNVRRHGAGLLVKLGSKYPLLLLPVFGRLHELCLNTLARPDLSALESVTLQEALLLVSNHFCCYERQSALVAQVLGDCRERWAALSPHLQSAAGLARLLGLDAPPNEDDPERAQARRTLLHALTLTLGVVKRTQVPADPDKASRGGFSAGVTPSGNPVWRNPCGAHVLPLFPAALSLARALHELHSPQAASLRYPAHARALQPPPAERRNLLGLRDEAPPAPMATPQDRMQNLLHTLHENVCGLVGAAAASLGRELFGVANLAHALAVSLLAAPEKLPDHWLRRVLRSALRPLMLHCPSAHYADVALPLMRHLAPIMLVHLNHRWEYVTSLYESGKLEEEGGSESQEVLEDMLVRHLTREHLDLLKVSLVEGGVSTEPSTDMEEETPPANPGRAPEQVSELGAIILADPIAGPAVLHTILRALTWNDSTSSLRACALALPALRAAISAHEAGGATLGAGEAAGALAAVLHALRLHGQHEANQAALLALAVQVYEALRPRFPNVASVLRAIPDVDAHDLQRLDEKLAANTNKPAKIDKSKRDLFKKITSRLIGRNVGQLFKKEVFVLNLPAMQTAQKDKPRSALDTAEGAGLEHLFNPNAPT
ncbi:jg22168, partial [Pararge aegeria aegeria]